MKRTIIQDPSVTTVLERSGVTDEELRKLELEILRGAGSTVGGTGGLKKIRCGSAGRGKRGSVRVMFADYPRVGRTYLLAAFAKNEQSDLTGEERSELRAAKQALDKAIERLV